MKTIMISAEDRLAEAIAKWFASGQALMQLSEDPIYFEALGLKHLPDYMPECVLKDSRAGYEITISD